MSFGWANLEFFIWFLVWFFVMFLVWFVLWFSFWFVFLAWLLVWFCKSVLVGQSRLVVKARSLCVLCLCLFVIFLFVILFFCRLVVWFLVLGWAEQACPGLCASCVSQWASNLAPPSVFKSAGGDFLQEKTTNTTTTKTTTTKATKMKTTKTTKTKRKTKKTSCVSQWASTLPCPVCSNQRSGNFLQEKNQICPIWNHRHQGYAGRGFENSLVEIFRIMGQA